MAVVADDELARRTRFNVFYGSLTAADAVFLRCLLLLPPEFVSDGGEWGIETAAVATGTSYHQARAVIQRLVALSLLRRAAGGYAVADAHRPYIAALVDAEEHRLVAERLNEWRQQRAGAGGLPRVPRQ